MLGEIVFVGGQMAEILVTDPGAVRVRATEDVDIVVSVGTRSAYREIELRLKALGFEPDTRQGAPICRTISRDGIVLDTMPLDEDILGFSNPWYPYAIESAMLLELEEALTIRSISGPAFVATKWQAYLGRGRGDPLTSPDLEDIVTVIAGRESLVDEVKRSPNEARAFIRTMARDFLNERWAEEIVESAVRDAQRFPELRSEVMARFALLATS
jgi:predicted nucleotidyltransferase